MSRDDERIEAKGSPSRSNGQVTPAEARRRDVRIVQPSLCDQNRLARRNGFDSPSASTPLHKIQSELAVAREAEHAQSSGRPERLFNHA